MAKTDSSFDAFLEQLADAVARRLGSGRSAASSGAKGNGRKTKKKRNMSPEGIERIRAAAKKRWAKYRRENPGK